MMNHINFKEFIEIETKNCLFDMENKYGFRYWDAVRHDVSQFVCYNNFNSVEKRHRNIFRIIKKCIIVFSELLILLKIIINKHPRYLIFSCSRNKDKQGRNIDIILHDIIADLPPEDRLLIETYATKKCEFKCIHNSILSIESGIRKLKEIIIKKQVNDKYETIVDVFDKKCGFSDYEKEILKNIIIQAIKYYEITKSYYKRLFSLIAPKMIFMVQNGIQKGMFNAAHALKIPVIEFQHGFIGYRHLAYSYHTSIERMQIPDIPDYLLVFSPYWASDIHFPCKSIISIGNNYHAVRIKNYVANYALTFILGTFDEDLLLIVKELLQNGYKKKICIKLHPQSYFEYNKFTAQFNHISNVEVITNEYFMTELLSMTEYIVTVDSTCIYEALHNNVKVLLLNIPGYDTMQNIYDDSLVEVIETADDILSITHESETATEKKGKSITYFEEFKEDVFNALLKEINVC